LFKFGLDAALPLNGIVEQDANGDFLFTPNRDADVSGGIVYLLSDGADGTAEGYIDIQIVPSNDDPTVVDDPGFVTPFDVPLVIRVADMVFNDYDIEQADSDGDGIINVDLDDPDRDRPTFVGIDGVYDPIELAQGNRVPLGTFEIVTFRGEDFLVARFNAGYTGDVAIEYRIADEQGLEDTGFAFATVADFYGLELSGTPFVDYIEGTDQAESIFGYRRDDWIVALDGDDTIETGAGADLIEAGAGNDIINAGDDADDVRGGSGFDILQFAGSNTGVRADLQSLVGQGGYAQGDQYSELEGFEGTNFNDTLGGDDVRNILDGKGGNDELIGRGGDDDLIGDLGDDTLEGGEGADDLDGGEGTDTGRYENSSASVQISLINGTATGGEAEGDVLTSIENLIGTDYDDRLEGDNANNELVGGRGNDTLIGLDGDDLLTGGRGADSIVGGLGTDTADYVLSNIGINIDLQAGTAAGGDAEGDVLDSIEVIQASNQDDTLRGDAGDNTFRGNLGADLMDGRDGIDIADYARADAAVSVDLSTGLGTAGEALGDQLISIEGLVGSIFADTFTGSDAAEIFDGRFGNDTLIGALGSDDYLFGFDSSADTIIENENAGDIDRLVLGSGIATKDVSLLRQGDDLFVELERDDGFLIDTVTVTDHFLGTWTGLEQIVFEDGTVWDRAAIQAGLRDGRFNAQNDVFRLGVEDEVALIDPADLVLNDADEGTDDLVLVSVQNAEFGTVLINADGMIEFLGAQDHFGDAFFAYTVRDPLGRESTARVEVNLSPVNDAPVANPDPLQYGVEDVPLRIRIENLLANDYDVDGDNEAEGLRIIRVEPLTDINGDPLRPYEDRTNYSGPATDATWRLSGDYVEFLGRPDHFGFAGFRYVLADNDGAEATADVEIYFAPVNDAPRISDTQSTARLNQVTEFTVQQLMARVYDIEGDDFSFVGLHIGADGNASSNGVETFDEAAGIISFTPGSLGQASIAFDVIDARGAEAVLDFQIRVIPENLAPRAKDDRGFRLLQEGSIIIDPADLLLNDTDPDGDTVFFDSVYRFAENGKVRVTDDGMIEFIARDNYNGSASFEYTINDGRGLTDTAVVNLTILPVNNGPVLRNDIVTGLEDGPQFVIPAEAFGNDLDLDGDVLFFQDTELLGQLTNRFLSPDYEVRATSANNTDLPDWLFFDAATMTFSGIVPAEQTDRIEVAVFLTDPSNNAVHVSRFGWEPGDRAGDLATGIQVQDAVLNGFEVRSAHSTAFDADGDGVASFDIAAGTFAAQVNGGRSLPNWLVFDAATRSLSISDFGVDDQDQTARVQIVFTPDSKPVLPEFEFYSTERGFTLEFVIDPDDPQLDAINAILAGDPTQEALGLFALDLTSGPGLSAARESGAPLNSWITFDPATLGFSGMPPSEYVGAVPVRIDINGGGLPQMSVITEVVVDETFTVIEPGRNNPFRINDLPERIDVVTPEDFNGSLAFTYDAEDEKGGQSDTPATIVFNVRPTREMAKANDDEFDLIENEFITFALTDLIDNDRDDDGDALRITELGPVTNGVVEITLAQVVILAPPTLVPLSGGTWSAELADGSALPDWMSVDAVNGTLSATVPIDVLGDFEIRFINSDGATTQSETTSTSFDGNADTMITYRPTIGFSGIEEMSYTLTDDAEGPVTGTVVFDVESRLDPPSAVTDQVNALEDGVLTLTPAELLANDVDPDGDPIRFVGVGDAENGTVSFDGTTITFIPAPDFSGLATFTYTITDDRHGESEGLVRVNVVSTNQAPEAVTDTFVSQEDTPVEFTIDDLLSNDTDPDGDALTFRSISTETDGGRLLELPDGRYQFVPDENVTGQVSFSYSITDGRLSDTGAIVFDIQPVNDAPIANPDGIFFGTQDEEFRIDFADLLFNDRDVEGDTFSIVEVFDGDNGTVYRDGEQAVFQGRPGYFGDGGFFYRVTDEFGATNTGYVTVIVMPLFDVPVAVSDAGYEMLEDTFLDIDPADLMANDDIPLGSEVTFLGLETFGLGSRNATVEELDNGLWRVTTAEDFFGELVLRYALTNETGFEVPTTVTIDVLGVADAPEAQDDALTVIEDTPLAIFVTELTANDSDPDRQAIIITRILDAENVTAELTDDGQVIITPDAGFAGEGWFDYELQDSGGTATTARVAVTVQPVNDPPILADIGDLFGAETAAFSLTLPADVAFDPDGDALIVDLRGVGGTALPDWLSYDQATRELTGTPPLGSAGVIELELFADDGQIETVQTISFSIAEANRAPEIAPFDLTGTEDTPLALTLDPADFTDVDGDVLTIDLRSEGGGALPTWLSFDPTTLELTGTPPADFHGDVALEAVADDGTIETVLPVTLTIDPVNDAPEIAPFDLSGTEDTPLALTLDPADFTDVDGDALTIDLRSEG
ncbi:MAG: tandem-95 repeat protein, partial [Tateyamaria sp.]